MAKSSIKSTVPADKTQQTLDTNTPTPHSTLIVKEKYQYNTKRKECRLNPGYREKSKRKMALRQRIKSPLSTNNSRRALRLIKDQGSRKVGTYHAPFLIFEVTYNIHAHDDDRQIDTTELTRSKESVTTKYTSRRVLNTVRI